MRRIGIVGAGWIGHHLSKMNGWELVSGDILNLDFANYVANNFSVVVNAAGKTGHPNVDWCEENWIETRRANVIGPCILQDACSRARSKLVHLGSGCLWRLETNVRETTQPDPPSYYGHTKAMADNLLLGANDKSTLIVRLRMPIHFVPHPRNLITKVLSYRDVVDTPNSVTELDLLAYALDKLIKEDASGLFNVANRGIISPWNIIEAFDVESEHTRIDQDTLDATTVALRSNCTLDVSKVEKIIGRIPEINLNKLAELYKVRAKYA